MKVRDLFPPVDDMNDTREVDGLSKEAWEEVIERLNARRAMYDYLTGLATNEMFRRYPRGEGPSS